MKRNLLFLLGLLYCNIGWAQQDAAKDAALRDIFRRIAEADGYHYQVSVTSVLSDSQKMAPVITDNYQSHSRFLLWARSAEAVFFVCSRGQFRVDHLQKTIWYKQYHNDSALAEARAVFDMQGTGLLDSLFLNGAQIAKKTSTKNVVHYKLSYPDHMLFQDLDLVYVPKDSFISSMRYTMDRSVEAGRNQVSMRQIVLMDHYKKEMPEEVKRLQAAAEDLEQWLKQSYNGYSLQKI